jgi:hypothetical protein
MKAVSLLFLFYEKKRIKNVLVVVVIMFKNGVSKMVISVSDVLIVATVLSSKMKKFH